MKKLIGFSLRKINTRDLKYHYLRVGKAGQLLDRLKEVSENDNITWVNEDVSSFKEIHFSKNFSKLDGAVINLAIDDENLAQLRKEFWEKYIWENLVSPLVFVLVIPDISRPGSLTKSQIIEGLSLIRLTDRPFEIVENKKGAEKEIIKWLTRMTAIVHRQERMNEESVSS